MKKLGPINPDIENWDLLLLACGKIDDLIDLVNSQQEAIGELQTEIGVLRNMVLQSQEAIKKLEKVITRETVRIATDDIIDALSGSEEPIEMVSKARYAEKLGIHDTHRTVTLRIPKGMTFVEALFYADLSLNMSDNQAQKALDEVKK